MAKKNIGKILEKGTAKQRMLLLANHIAETATNKPGFLSDSEFTALVESFKTPAEIRLYGRYKAASSALQSLLPYLAQLRLSYRVEYTRIEGYCLVYHSYLNFETSVNLVLESIKDSKQRATILDAFIKNAVVHFAIPKKDIVDSEKKTEFFDLSIIKSNEQNSSKVRQITLSEIITDHRNRAMKLLSSIKTLLKALKDYIEENDIQITAYNDFIKEIENEINKDKPPIPNSLSTKGVQIPMHEHYDFRSLRVWLDFSKERNFYPEYDKAEINQSEYDNYRSNYL